MDLEYQQKQLKILYRKIYDEVFKLDLYSQPLSLTYKGKTNFSTTYGMTMTVITLSVILVVIIDTLFFGDSFQIFPFQSSLLPQTSFNIDVVNDMGTYFIFEYNSSFNVKSINIRELR